jgi:hypothetical protein
MDFFDEINGLKYLFLKEIEEPGDNQLLINIVEAGIAETEEKVMIGDKSIGPARAIGINDNCKKYSFYFQTYAAYHVINESYSMYHEHEERVGSLFCLYSKSNYLDFIRSNTIVEYLREGELKHYAINCLNHIINIATMDEPIIERI